jgi:hypothetical protein
MNFQVVVENRRIGDGFKTFAETARAIFEEYRQLFERTMKQPFGTRIFYGFDVAWLAYKLDNRWYIVFFGDFLHFCVSEHLMVRIDDKNLAREPTEAEVRAFFRKIDDLHRSVYPALMAEKEKKLLEYIQ